MHKPMIKPVENNQDKANTYRELIGRYNKAIQYDFYYEAMLLGYALLEDRLLAMLYHMGIVTIRSPKNPNKRVSPLIKPIISEYKQQDESDNMNLTAITGKVKVIRAILRWTEYDETRPNDRYLSALRYQCEGVDIQAVYDAFDDLQVWCKYRNAVIHALFNKNILSVSDELKQRSEESLQIARVFDQAVREIKKGNKIRKAAKLQTL